MKNRDYIQTTVKARRKGGAQEVLNEKKTIPAHMFKDASPHPDGIRRWNRSDFYFYQAPPL